MNDKRLALVTGAATGLGAAIAIELARVGMDIVLVDRDDMSQTGAAIAKLDARGHAIVCDITDQQAVLALRDEVEALGGVDVLVNNAGIYPFIAFEDLDFEKWRTIQATNLDSVFLLCKALLPGMKARGWGRIVNIASNAYMNGADPMLTGYVSSKGGMIGLSRALANEYGAYGITVNVVAPGLLVTDTTIRAIGGRPGDPGADKWGHMTALQAIKRSGTPQDVVGAVAFFASEQASYITAQTLVVDGGLARI